MQYAGTGNTQMSVRLWALLMLLGLIWGGSFFFARVAVLHVPPFTLVLARVALAALALYLYIRGRYGLYPALAARWREFLVMGLINNAIPHALIFLGQTHIGAGLAAILNATTPVWTVLIANMATEDEKLSAAKINGCLLGLAGTIVLIGPNALSDLFGRAGDVPLWALVLPVLAAVSYGFSATYGKRFRNLAPTVTATGQLTASTILMLPVAAFADMPWTLPMPSVTAIGAILGLAFVSTAYAYILFFRIMAEAGATNTSLVTLLVPPSAILLGYLFLGERLQPIDFAGMALIAAGLAVLDGRILRPRRPA
ncbi:Permease of the drug/metabolite transporter (DMT) superfamily [Sinorhizobium sojae CCBAU 05684]|uniref:Permease of the drug/metabolite transporter (DMT) superfamily n=2 Tax=Sinorhizobium sojae TaxID=716925 RepID=A0A249PCS0_9HYPH|nr:DMT family transporter [Sinorhizobium sojae]ASY63723.1 Permease of the drug/metabolite transporter (DMT) superfamily [Sinorhizobium sojae CCBAU 05684]